MPIHPSEEFPFLGAAQRRAGSHQTSIEADDMLPGVGEVIDSVFLSPDVLLFEGAMMDKIVSQIFRLFVIAAR